MTAGTFIRIDGDALVMWCPGCDDAHRVTFAGPNAWEWDGDRLMPTIRPSIMMTGVQWEQGAVFYRPQHSKVPTGHEIRCHSYVTNGQWQFLEDCTHELAGQTVPMAPLPEHLEA